MARNQEEFDDYIERLLADDPTLRELDLLREALTYEDFTLLTNAIQDNTSITKLTLGSSNPSDDTIIALANAIQDNTSITELYLGFINLGNLSEEALSAFANAIQYNTSITKLTLGFNNPSDDTIIALANAIQYNTSITSLNLSDNELGNLSDDTITELANAIQYNTSITELLLEANKLGSLSEKAFSELANAIQHNTSITELYLGWNHLDNLSDEAIGELANAIQHNTSITKLSLIKNDLGKFGRKPQGIQQILARNQQYADAKQAASKAIEDSRQPRSFTQEEIERARHPASTSKTEAIATLTHPEAKAQLQLDEHHKHIAALDNAIQLLTTQIDTFQDNGSEQARAAKNKLLSTRDDCHLRKAELYEQQGQLQQVCEAWVEVSEQHPQFVQVRFDAFNTLHQEYLPFIEITGDEGDEKQEPITQQERRYALVEALNTLVTDDGQLVCEFDSIGNEAQQIQTVFDSALHYAIKNQELPRGEDKQPQLLDPITRHRLLKELCLRYALDTMTPDSASAAHPVVKSSPLFASPDLKTQLRELLPVEGVLNWRRTGERKGQQATSLFNKVRGNLCTQATDKSATSAASSADTEAEEPTDDRSALLQVMDAIVKGVWQAPKEERAAVATGKQKADVEATTGPGAAAGAASEIPRPGSRNG